MGARTPEDVDREFAVALNSGNIDALVALYEPDASLTAQPGSTVKGHAAIREALSGLISAKPHITLTPRVVTQAGDVALVSAQWQLALTGADGKPTSMSGKSVEVIRRQRDGNWLFAMDEPFGV
jgi:uncharacterized protein (TIGR02246 family)